MVSVGSVGDILALIELAATISQALIKSSGASKEYQNVITEIDAFSAALKTLRASFPATPAGPNRLVMQPSVENAIRHALSQCQILMKLFLRSIEGYQSLSQKKGLTTAAWRKIGWGLFKSADLVTLRNQLAQHKNTMTLMLAYSNR